jgi:O-antigen/teichoic acid export membrane protein
LLSFILGIYTVNVSVLISKERIAAANMLGIVQSAVIILYLLFSFAIRNRMHINSYIESLYAGYLVSMVFSFFMIRQYFRGYAPSSLTQIPEALKQLVVLGFYNQIAVFTQMLSFRISYYILNQYYGTDSVGLYANAITVAESVWLIARSMGMVQYSKIVNTREKQFSLNLTYRMLRACFGISLVLLIIMAFIPDAVYGFVFGKEFTALQSLIRMLAPGILFFACAIIMLNYFSGTGRQYINAVAGSAGLVVTLLLGFFIIPLYGLQGAAATASISYGITALVSLIFFIREEKK